MNIQKMMQQAQLMQSKIQDMQEELKNIIVSGQSGGGAVKISMSCKGIVHSVEIDPSLMQPSEKEMLEDLIKAAMNDARKKADDTTESETKRIMKDMGLPAGMGLPF